MKARHFPNTNAVPGGVADTGRLRAGVAKSDITTNAEGAVVRDPLYAKALVLDDGRTRVAVVAMDTTATGGRSITQRMLDDVGEEFLPALHSRIQSELGIPGHSVLVNASHTLCLLKIPSALLCLDL